MMMPYDLEFFLWHGRAVAVMKNKLLALPRFDQRETAQMPVVVSRDEYDRTELAKPVEQAAQFLAAGAIMDEVPEQD